MDKLENETKARHAASMNELSLYTPTACVYDHFLRSHLLINHHCLRSGIAETGTFVSLEKKITRCTSYKSDN